MIASMALTVSYDVLMGYFEDNMVVMAEIMKKYRGYFICVQNIIKKIQ